MNGPKSIPFGRPWITDEDREAVLEVLQGPILTHGPQTRAFEEEFAQFLGGECHCVAVSSCTAALHLAYFQMGLGPGDEVIVPAQTHAATAHTVELVGARPIFADCTSETGNIDAASIEALISPRTKAIAVVHFLGIPCDMDAIGSLANRYGLKVIEDCALALGAQYKGRQVGLFGDAGCFSFYPVKHITTGDGGMFVTRDPKVAAVVSRLRAFGMDRTYAERSIPGMYDVVALGFNYRMSEMQAALGRTQLGKIRRILDLRYRNFARLRDSLSGVREIAIIDSTDEVAASSHYCLTVVLQGSLAARRNEVVARLNAAGVGTSVYYPHPVPRLAYYRNKYGYDGSTYPNAAAISDRSIALPVAPHLEETGPDFIAGTLRHVLEEVK